MVEAVARAAEVPAAAVRRALMLAGELPPVAGAAFAKGPRGSSGSASRCFVPSSRCSRRRPRTSRPRSTGLALRPRSGSWTARGCRCTVSAARCARSRGAWPTSPTACRRSSPRSSRLPVEAVVLDGEVIALRPDGRPHPFQISMSRFGSSAGTRAEGRPVPLSPFFFDCLHLDGDDLLDRTYEERVAALDRVVPDGARVPRAVTTDADEAERFLEDALARGHEGVVVKALEAPYEAGRRGAAWVKVKRATTLDLVVLAAEWGHGRRQGKLSNLHLGARDPEGGFVMLGKTFKGMTDEMLAWQTGHLLDLATERDGHVVHVRPELVVEIAFDGVQESRRYPGGLALRFARVKGYRPDKAAAEADTIDLVRALHAGAARESGARSRVE